MSEAAAGLCDLTGQAAIVTGSTSGIGQAVAEALARRGARVTVTGLDRASGERIVEAIGQAAGQAMFIEADLTDPRAPERLAAETADRWGRIDIVVNNAAMVCSRPVERIAHEDWDALLQVNLKAPFFLVQAALPWLKRSRGTVVAVSSINGIRNDRNNLVYDTIKAALNHMTQGLALDLREAGIRCNAVMPGGVATPLLNQWYGQLLADPVEAEKRAEAAKRAPNVADPRQIADAVLYLCSAGASWLNGAVIPVDGGFHLG